MPPGAPTRRLALALGDATAQPLPLAAAANELYKKVGPSNNQVTPPAHIWGLPCTAPRPCPLA